MKFCIKTTHDRKEKNEIYFSILQKPSCYRMLIVTFLSYFLLVYEIIWYGEFQTLIILYSIYCLYLPFHIFFARWIWVYRKDKAGEIPYHTEILFYDSHFECKVLDSNRIDVRPYKLIKKLKQTKNYYILIVERNAYVISKEAVPEEQRDSFRNFLAAIVSQ